MATLNPMSIAPPCPAIWMIGDVQGCCSALERLLAHPDMAVDAHTRFWFAGDLVNRGPRSLDTLRRIMALGERAVSVLGNHDLHLLALAAGVRRPGKGDTVADILDAPDAESLINWLRQRPLAHFEADHLLVHAGVLPQWNVAQTLALAGEVEQALRAPTWQTTLKDMYGNEPRDWKDSLSGTARLRVIINACTRMRLCTPKGRMDLSDKGSPRFASCKEGLIPWYDVPQRATRDLTVVFGHWSTLGFMMRPDAICLDSGCLWGGQLTAVRLHDRRVVQIECEQAQRPGGRRRSQNGYDF